MAGIATSIACLSSFLLLYLYFRAALIPADHISTPRPMKLVFTSLGATAAWFIGLAAGGEAIRSFSGMLSLSLILTPAIAPDMRDANVNKEDGLVRRVIETVESKVSGALLVKLVCVPVLMTSTFIGKYWLAVLGGIAIMGLLGSGQRRRSLLQSSMAFGELPAKDRIALVQGTIKRELWSVGALSVWLSVFGLVLIDQATIWAGNWNGWLGLGVGAFLALAASAIGAE